jgi:two-component system cell cycle sensor histidine kinase/response regulator CckA
LDVNAVATELTRGLGRLVGEHIKISLRLDATIGAVRADRAQLEQVLLNLLVNARDAMPSGGVITLSTRHATPLDFAELSASKDPAQFVALIVADTGVGMDEQTRTRLFEPFFTTKAPGYGTGLGLATVYGIIEKHGGHVSVASATGRGTTFTVLLPAARRSAMTIEAVKAPAALGRKAASGTILLVEDDASLRRAALRTLRARGYEVIEARDGEEALHLANAYRERIDVVITDVVMPRMAGPKLVSELRARRPDIQTIYVSGYTFDMLDPNALEDGSFLTKPFAPEDLLGAVLAALGSS